MRKIFFLLLSCIVAYGPVNAMEQPDKLINAAEQGNIEQVRALLDSGAHVNKQGIYSRTALLMATLNRHQEIVQLLLDRGADIHLQDIHGFAPLHCAASWCQLEFIKLFLEHGADINQQGKYGTPLEVAIDGGMDEISKFLTVKFLLEHGADVTTGEEKAWSPLVTAISKGAQKIVQLLLEHGAHVNIQDPNGTTPLHWAASKGNKEIIMLLLARGADVTIRDRKGRTPEELAREDLYHKETADEIDRILFLGPKIISVSSDQRLAFCMAMHPRTGTDSPAQLLNQYLFQEICSYLRPKELIHDQQAFKDSAHMKDLICMERSYPLHTAAYLGDTNQVKTLLDQGANINLQDDCDKTPLYLAACNGKEAFSRTPLAVYQGHEAIVQLLLERGANVDLQSNDGETPLHSAVCQGDEAIVRLLLDNNANINLKDHCGYTPLHWAALIGYEAIVRLILARGADTSLQNDAGETLMQIATGRHQGFVLQIANDRVHQGVVQIIKEHIKTQALALAMGLHPHLGENSPVNLQGIDTSILKNIFGNLNQ